MGTHLSDYRRGRQPKTRNHIAVDAHMRNSAGPMGKRGKGRARYERDDRATVKVNLRKGDWE